MRRSLALLMGTLLVVAAGCSGSTTAGDGGPGTTDGGGVTDAAPAQTDGPAGLVKCQLPSGCVGGPCTADTDCMEGKTGVAKVCWKEVLLNNPKYVPTPGGYCSLECTSDSDCGTGYCFQPPGETKKYCMAQCKDGSTCRHPGYACTFEGATAICFPDVNLDCSPIKGSCDAPIDNGATTPGGCIPAAYEDKGICHIACAVGTKTCPPDVRFGTVNAPPQHCVFLDSTVDSSGNSTGDKFKGPVCLETGASPTPAGMPCTYWDECQDGYQCDRYGATPADRVCRRQCAQGPTGVQSKDLYVAPGGTAYDNKCPGANEICANELQAGLTDGTAGLCLVKK